MLLPLKGYSFMIEITKRFLHKGRCWDIVIGETLTLPHIKCMIMFQTSTIQLEDKVPCEFSMWKGRISDSLFEGLLNCKLTKADELELMLYNRCAYPVVKSYLSQCGITDHIKATLYYIKEKLSPSSII